MPSDLQDRVWAVRETLWFSISDEMADSYTLDLTEMYLLIDGIKELKEGIARLKGDLAGANMQKMTYKQEADHWRMKADEWRAEMREMRKAHRDEILSLTIVMGNSDAE